MPDATEALAALWFDYAHPEVGWENANGWWKTQALKFANGAIASEWLAGLIEDPKALVERVDALRIESGGELTLATRHDGLIEARASGERVILDGEAAGRLAAWLIEHAPTCRHCGKPPETDGDHSCPCPYRDDDCPNHSDV